MCRRPDEGRVASQVKTLVLFNLSLVPVEIPMKPLSLLLAALFLLPCSARAQSKIAAPWDIRLLACGKGKLALYWNAIKGAKGYWIYRSTHSKKQNMNEPLAKLRFVADSYPGSPMKLWVDRGLKEQKWYFYVIKSVDAGGRLSAASKEESEYVDSTATPWDSKDPRKIVESIVAESQHAREKDERVGLSESLIVIGPDGMTYSRYKGRYSKEKPQPAPFAMPTA